MNLDSLLVKDFGVGQVDLEKAKSYQNKHGGRLEKLLVNMGSLSESDLIPLYQKLLALPALESVEDLAEQRVSVSQASEQGLERQVFDKEGWYLYLQNDALTALTADPLNWKVQQYLAASNKDLNLVLADKTQVAELLQAEQQVTDADAGLLSNLEEDRLRELASEAPTVNLLNSLIAKGVTLGASDLHIEPSKQKYKLRYRVDGVLQEEGYLPVTLQLALISRVKILANMDIAEKRRPQDGKIETRVSNVDLDIRVSILPLNDGESVVMRFLRQESIKYDMETLGLSADIRRAIRQDLTATAGVILLTGPTGSGKTTSLYTFLSELNDDKVKIITLEDPVEYQLDGINQVQVNSDIGFDFAAGLRSIVRQDPDIIMVGEIRDKETAQIAMQAALTGHLVFSTVHTNDAPSAYTRLVDLGVEEFLLNAAIVSVMAQRLVRKLCTHCAQPDPSALAAIEKHNLGRFVDAADIHLKVPVGCEHCLHSGYRGRMSIMEYLRCDEDIRRLDKDEYFIPEARKLNAQKGHRTLLEDGLLKACLGQTSIEEVLRVCA